KTPYTPILPKYRHTSDPSDSPFRHHMRLEALIPDGTRKCRQTALNSVARFLEARQLSMEQLNLQSRATTPDKRYAECWDNLVTIWGLTKAAKGQHCRATRCCPILAKPRTSCCMIFPEVSVYPGGHLYIRLARSKPSLQ
ncbi:TPA: hypothetical protein N0F65_004010, partial [Lagenidium giganteum]